MNVADIYPLICRGKCDTRVKRPLSLSSSFTLCLPLGRHLTHCSYLTYMTVGKIPIDRGANMNLRDKEGWTLLHLVSAHGHLNIVRLLVDRGADMNAKEQDLWTLLHLASRNGRLEVVQLLEHGASVNELMGELDFSWH